MAQRVVLSICNLRIKSKIFDVLYIWLIKFTTFQRFWDRNHFCSDKRSIKSFTNMKCFSFPFLSIKRWVDKTAFRGFNLKICSNKTHTLLSVHVTSSFIFQNFIHSVRNKLSYSWMVLTGAFLLCFILLCQQGCFSNSFWSKNYFVLEWRKKSVLILY